MKCGLSGVEVHLWQTDTSAFEAAQTTDAVLSSGHTLVNRHSPRLRRRFSIAHELGHFLIEAYQPGAGHPMQCALGDLRAVGPPVPLAIFRAAQRTGVQPDIDPVMANLHGRNQLSDDGAILLVASLAGSVSGNEPSS